MSGTGTCSICGGNRYTFVNRTNTQGQKASDVCHLCNGSILKTVNRHNNRARNRGLIATLTCAQWIEILQKSEGYCIYCKEHEGCDQLTPDHIVPISKGGANSADNIVAACFFCNSGKMDNSVEHWMDWLQSHHLDHVEQPGVAFIRSIWREEA